MKECPRCGSTLSRYAHGDGEAYGCDACGWVGVDVEHRSEPVRLESWTDAITRFEAKFGSKSPDDVPGTLDRVDDPVEVPADDAESDPEPAVDRVPSDDAVDADDSPDESDTDDSSADGNTTESDADRDEDDDVESEDATADTEDEGVDDNVEDGVDDENQAEAA